MTTTAQPEGTLRRLVKGGLEGACTGAIVVALLHVVQEGSIGPGTLAKAGLAGALLGGCLGLIGRGIARGLTGALVGAVLGLFAGGMIADHLGGPAPVATISAEEEAATPTLDIAGPTLEGGQFDLKDLRGKVVLVDFWATWCGPCIAELPNVLEVYQRHHGQGFEVVGISLDADKDQLRRFVQEKKIPWPQIIFEEEKARGWYNPIARLYNISSIPATILVNTQGRVAATDLRGNFLETEVAKLVGQPVPLSAQLSRLAARILRLGTNSRGFIFAVLAGGFLGALLGALVERSARHSTVKT